MRSDLIQNLNIYCVVGRMCGSKRPEERFIQFFGNRVRFVLIYPKVNRMVRGHGLFIETRSLANKIAPVLVINRNLWEARTQRLECSQPRDLSRDLTPQSVNPSWRNSETLLSLAETRLK